MWARQDSNLQSIQGVDLQSTRLPITGYVPEKKQMCIFKRSMVGKHFLKLLLHIFVIN